MPADIFGEGLDRNVDAKVQRLEHMASTPGVVHQAQDPATARNGGQGRHILHFETERAGTFQEDQPGPRPYQRLDLIGRKGGVIIPGRDAEPGEGAVAEPAGRLVGRIGHQEFVASLEHGEQGAGDGGDTAWIELDGLGAFKVAEGGLQGLVRGQATATVGDKGVIIVEGLGVGQQDSRALLDQRVHSRGGLCPRPGRMNEAARRLHASPVTTSPPEAPPHSAQEPS